MRTTLDHLDRTAFERYLDVVNRALFSVRGSLPYNAVLRGLQAELGSRPFVVTRSSSFIRPPTASNPGGPDPSPSSG